jgi:hypothetical protein
VTSTRFSLRQATQEDVPFLLRLRETAMDPHHHAAGVFQTPTESYERLGFVVVGDDEHGYEMQSRV